MTENINMSPKDYADNNIPDIGMVYDEIINLYLKDSSPWIVGYSGGKDSTTTLQLIYCAIQKIPKINRHKQVYVLCSDTLVETPPIIQYIKNSLNKIELSAKTSELPISVVRVEPRIEKSFWVSLIGKGYPSPNRWFRWCTDALKIQPSNKFILEKVSQFGEVIIALGVRRSESATRAQSLKLHQIEGSTLRRHTSLPNAFVYAPIEYWSTNAVWSYLLQAPSPWGGDNRALFTLYRNAQAGECPLVIDTFTPSCGNSRFGCWTCTVVEKDHSMSGFIETGYEHLTPMLEMRNWLAEIRNMKEKRSYKRRTGGTGLGPFTLETRREILTRLLDVQKKVGMELIQPREIELIHQIWTQEGDWQGGVSSVVQELDMGHLGPKSLNNERGTFGQEEDAVLQKLCDGEGVPHDLVKRMLQIEREATGLARRRGIYDRLVKALDETWMTKEQVAAYREAEALEEMNASQKTDAE